MINFSLNRISNCLYVFCTCTYIDGITYIFYSSFAGNIDCWIGFWGYVRVASSAAVDRLLPFLHTSRVRHADNITNDTRGMSFMHFSFPKLYRTSYGSLYLLWWLLCIIFVVDIINITNIKYKNIYVRNLY